MLRKFTWGHGIVLALGLFISFILFMIFIFPNGKDNAEMVSDNYYEDELEYQQVIDAKNNAQKLPQLPKLQQDPSGLTIIFDEGNRPENGEVLVNLFRTNDHNLDVKTTQSLRGNILQVPAKVLVKGSYTLKIKWQKNRTPYQVDYDVLWK